MYDGRKIRIALDRYDRHFPLFDRTVSLSGDLEYEALQVGQSLTLRDGTNRHGRMLNGSEFDVAEFSMSTFIMAFDRGVPLIGIPIFPRRLFSQSSMYVLKDSVIRHPSQLAGKKVGLFSFQTSLSVIARGDLENEYGVDCGSIEWCVSAEEKLPLSSAQRARISRLDPSLDLGDAMTRGVVDAIFVPNPPQSSKEGRVSLRNLFDDTRAEELRYYEANRIWPIMHVIVTRPDVLEKYPSLRGDLEELFASATKIAKQYYLDPNWSLMPWFRTEFERCSSLIDHAWEVGVERNGRAVAQFIEYSRSQGLISRSISPEELFRQ